MWVMQLEDVIKSLGAAGQKGHVHCHGGLPRLQQACMRVAAGSPLKNQPENQHANVPKLGYPNTDPNTVVLVIETPRKILLNLGKRSHWPWPIQKDSSL